MKRMKRKSLLLLAGIALLLAAAVGLTSAYLIARTDSVENVFDPGNVSIEVNETFANGVKSNVTLKNTGNVTARIRTKIVVTWKDEAGNVSAVAPVQDTDYQMTMGSGWTLKDGTWVCDTAVAPGASTPVLIASCEATAGRAPEGYGLSVEILGEAVQNEPAGAGWQ